MAVVNHVGHCVTDLERSRRFYENVLGFTHQYDLRVPDGPASTLLACLRRWGCPPATSGSARSRWSC